MNESLPLELDDLGHPLYYKHFVSYILIPYFIRGDRSEVGYLVKEEYDRSS